MCESGEMGRRQSLGGRKGGEGKILGGWIQTRGLFCSLKAPVCLQQMDYCLLSPGEWVLRAPLVPRVARSLSHTSPLCPGALLHSVLFAVVLCLAMYLTFVNLFSYKTERFFFSFFSGRTRVIFLCTGCFVLSEEQVGRPVVTGEEC